MIIDGLWRRLNHLVPDPMCGTRGDEYDSIEWTDARTKPTATELQAITEAEMASAELEATAQKLANARKAFAAVLELLWDSLPVLQTAFSNPNGKQKLKAEAKNRYKAKL